MSPAAAEDQAIVEQLLKTVGELADELHPRQGLAYTVSLDAALDKDLGYDSLGRMELLVRLERAFDVSLSENLLASAETPRHLLRALETAQASVRPVPPQPPSSAPLDRVEDLPRRVGTLQEVLDWHVQAHPARPHIYLYRDSAEPETVSYQQLQQRAQRVAEGLRNQGLSPGQSVALMLPTSGDYFYCFFGVLLAGGIPVPIYPPARLSQVEDHLRRHTRILDNAQVTILITVPEARAVARLLKSLVGTLRHILDPELLRRAAAIPRPIQCTAEDTAFLQYTSGSTGNPKGVELSHANLLANVRAMGAAVAASSNDVFVSWLPLYHDMGLIGAWFGSLYFASPLVIMSPLTFLARPHNWLWALHRFRGTLSAAPNFAYELCLNKVRDEDIQGLDLSSWRLAFNGAEAVSPQTVCRFSERFQAYGFQPEAMTPVYGLAESSVGLTFPPLGRGPLIDRVQRDALSRAGRAEPAPDAAQDALQFVSCGRPLAGHQIRIVDAAGRELPERREGRLQFCGPSSTKGYFRNPDASRQLFHDAWLDTGDRAYTVDGEVYLTGRAKDIIIRAGRNIFPQEVEQAVGQIEGIRKGCVAVFGSNDPKNGTERIIVLAETRQTDPQERLQLQQSAQAVVTDLIQMPPDELLLVPPQSVLKTSSGKIRRAACRALYEQGGIGRGRRHVWWQFVRLTASSVVPQLRKSLDAFAALLYAGYAWLLFLLLAVPVWLLAVLLPRISWRWAVIRGAARLLARALGVPLLSQGAQHVPRSGACVLVANHASYLDGIILAATLPTRFAFVAKAELQDSFVPRLFLRRIGSYFVERFDPRKGVEDSRRMARTANRGQALMIFPEGTFDRMPGLLPFRMGAFVAAAEAGLPVIPVALRGTRSLLRAGSWFPRRNPVHVIAAQPIIPQGEDWAAALALRDKAREAILRYSGEPDLGEQGIGTGS